jgi:UDP-3-O-[3-hydroxymyristoyl] glucosamine N-acyltransferase
VSLRLADLAVRFGCELRGDPQAQVDRLATLQGAGPGSLSFLANPRYIRYLEATRASAVVLGPESADRCPVAALVCANPYATYARIAQLLHPPEQFAGGRHPAAVVEPGSRVDDSAWIAAGACIEDGASIGSGCWVGPGSIVMAGASLGAGSRLVANVTVCRDVRIGARCLLHPGVVLGADGFGQAPDTGGYVKVPQIGTVVVGDDVEIGANSTVDRGAIEDTVIEEGVKIDNLVQIGHNTQVGAHTVIAGCVGISGSTRIGKRCMIGGQVGIAGHLEICDDVVLTGRTMVISSIREPGMYSSGLTADEARRFRRNAARFHQLDELAKRLRHLERAAAVGEREEE